MVPTKVCNNPKYDLRLYICRCPVSISQCEILFVYSWAQTSITVFVKTAANLCNCVRTR